MRRRVPGFEASVTVGANDGTVIELFEGGREPAFLLKYGLAGITPGLQIFGCAAILDKPDRLTLGGQNMAAHHRPRPDAMLLAIQI